LLSCKKTADDFQVDYGYDYYPLAVGKYLLYEVDSTIYDPTGDSMVQQKKSFVREVILDTLADNAGNTLFKIERFTRTADTLPWRLEKVLTASVSKSQAIRTEDNLRFIKLPFPLQPNTNWDGNAHFNPNLIVTVAGESIEMFKAWNYKVESVGKPEDIGSFSFPEVATIRQADSENLIELRVSREKYARGVGLIYREMWILDTQCIEACQGQSWEEKAEKGFILRQTLIDYN
jgi:hypothetical protein